MQTTFDQDHPPLIPSAPPDMGQTNRQPNSTPYAQQPLYPPGTIVTFRRPSEIGLISFKRNLTLLMIHGIDGSSSLATLVCASPNASKRSFYGLMFIPRPTLFMAHGSCVVTSMQLYIPLIVRVALITLNLAKLSNIFFL
ncbi:hypothetical protein V6N13_133715 [Hibiscus sabdariffa]